MKLLAMTLDRRECLAALGAGAGLVVAFRWPRQPPLTDQNPARLNAFVAIGDDGRVHIGVPVPEIGQGVRTALPMIVADELEAEWERVSVHQLPTDSAFGSQVVGGSQSVANHWDTLREAGAAAREMLVAAAAADWGVEIEECHAELGSVVHESSGRRSSYAALAVPASRLERPSKPRLKDPADFRLIGTSQRRVDGSELVTGAARFGVDVRVPDMLVAVIARCPVLGGELSEVDAEAARDVPGVVGVVRVPRLLLSNNYGAIRGGVAVVAENTWSALRGREALRIRWKEGSNATDGEDAVRERMSDSVDKAGSARLRDEGDAPTALKAAARRIQATYELPLLAHLCMEPMCFSADVRADGCDAWGPTQVPRWLQDDVVALLELPPHAVRIHPTLEGGGFGRRLAHDYGIEAVVVSKLVGKPVKVFWPREDDLQFDFFRPPSMHRLEAGVDADGHVVAWRHHLLTASLLEHIEGKGVEQPATYDARGGADVPYAIENLRFDYTPIDIGLQLGSWRSVSHSFNSFAIGCFTDELAHALGRDPLDFLLELHSGTRRTIDLALRGSRGRETWDMVRMRATLRAVADLAGWSSVAAKGTGRGVACSRFKDTYVAHVADVDVRDGRVHVQCVFTAIDCGRAVNPDGVRAQVEGSVMDGVATVLHWGVGWERGRVRPSNLDAQPMLRIDEAPEVAVHIIESSRPPSGTGEPPYPSVAPAIANAIFQSCGKRVRRLPIRPGELGD